MHIVLLIVGLTLTVLIGTSLAERLHLPAPMLLIALGIIGSYLPGMPTVQLTPEIVLLGLLPPLLYSSALKTSIVDIRANIRPVLLLSVALIVVTTFTVGATVHLLMPDIPWAVALALGAVVAPPDAVSASAVARRIGLPRQIVTVLEGESLLNDATALVALRSAVAAIAGAVSIASISLDFVIAAGGGILIGGLFAFVVTRVRRFVRDAAVDTGISFVVPFAAYLAAEEVGASGVIAVVVAGLVIGHRAPMTQTPTSRLTENATWNSIAFLLEHAVFLLIGLQFSRIVTGVDDSVGWAQTLGVCTAILAVVILTRILWLVLTRLVAGPFTRVDRREPWSHTLVTGWAGMRGVVTIAAVFVIPADVPHHDILVLAALVVVLGTLYLQGLTLPWLTRVLHVQPADPAADALARATLLQKAADAGLTELETCAAQDDEGVVRTIRERLDQRTFAAWERLSTRAGQEPPSEAYTRIRTHMIAAERAKVLSIRGRGRFPSQVVREVLGMLDLEESMLDQSSEAREDIVATGSGEGGYCEDLQRCPAVGSPDCERAVCRRCLEEGTTTVALRQCLECGEVACCDSSPGRHATEHFHRTGHPVMQSAEPGETWRWCYVHQITA